MRVMVIGEGGQEKIKKKRFTPPELVLFEAIGNEIVYAQDSENAPENGNQPLWNLGEIIKTISEVDAVYLMDDWRQTREGRLVYEACVLYGVPLWNLTKNEIPLLGNFVAKYYRDVFLTNKCCICGREAHSMREHRLKIKLENGFEWKYWIATNYVCELHGSMFNSNNPFVDIDVDYIDLTTYCEFLQSIPEKWKDNKNPNFELIYYTTKNLLQGMEAMLLHTNQLSIQQRKD